jgi:Matrixin
MSSKSKKSSTSSSKDEKYKTKRLAEARDLVSVSAGTCIAVSFFAFLGFILALTLLILAATDSPIFETAQSAAIRRNGFVNFVAKTNKSAASKFSRSQIKTMDRKIINQSNGHVFEIPKTAVKLSSDVYYLGESTYKNRGRVKGFVNIYRQKQNRTTTESNNVDVDLEQEVTGDVGVGCATFLALGTRWKGTAEPFSLGYFNPFGITPAEFENAIGDAMCTWQSELNYDVFGPNNGNSLADGPDSSPDGKNEIQFGFIADSSILATTTIWGVFDGPVEDRYIAETDLLFNEQQAYTLEGSSNTFSLKNILAHELGHWIGLGDIYDGTCKDATMYGYAAKGETKKTTLSKIDSDAIRALYGETSSAFPTNVECVSPFSDSAPTPGAATRSPPKKSDASHVLTNKNTFLLITISMFIVSFL